MNNDGELNSDDAVQYDDACYVNNPVSVALCDFDNDGAVSTMDRVQFAKECFGVEISQNEPSATSNETTATEENSYNNTASSENTTRNKCDLNNDAELNTADEVWFNAKCRIPSPNNPTECDLNEDGQFGGTVDYVWFTSKCMGEEIIGNSSETTEIEENSNNNNVASSENNTRNKCDLNKDAELNTADEVWFNAKCRIPSPNNPTECDLNEDGQFGGTVDYVWFTSKCMGGEIIGDNDGPNGKLVNNFKKTVEFKSNEVGRKTAFDGTIKALKDNVIIGEYSIDTEPMYEEGRDDSYFEDRCKKNKTNITFYVYIDGKLIGSRYYENACELGQGAGVGAIFDSINMNKGESKNVKVEVEIEGYVQEDDNYKFRLYIRDGRDGNIPLYGENSISADFAPITIVAAQTKCDMNSDGKINVADKVMFNSKCSIPDSKNLAECDFNGDGKLNVADTVYFNSKCYNGEITGTNTTTSDKQNTKIENKAEEKVTNKNQNIATTQTNTNTKQNYNNTKQNNYSSEMNEAYQFARDNGITTSKNIEKAKMNSPLTRIAMAKMLSNYAINVLGKEPDMSKGTPKFSDVSDSLNKKYDNAVSLAYQLGIMGQNVKSNNFRPYDEVTRAEFVTALSRMLYGTQDGKGNVKYYEPHMSKLYKEGIISSTNPKNKEKRGYVMIMLERTAQ